MRTEDKLNQLYGYQVAREARLVKKQELIDSVIPQEVKDRLAEIEVEFAETDEAKAKVATLEKEIRDEVIAAGRTIQGRYLMVTYADGRVTWDTKALEGYVVDHPELKQFRKVGDPITTLRKVK